MAKAFAQARNVVEPELDAERLEGEEAVEKLRSQWCAS
jgi:hypothetical protein